MADKKISALPAASTPLAGSEVLPIVQGGITEQVSVANLTAGRTVTGTAFSATAGNYSVATNYGLSFGAGSTYIYGSTASAYIRLDTNNVTRFEVNASGNAVVSTGNLVIGTAGKGIDFSAATHGAGMTSELLNDYEEGTWTPTISSGATGITYVAQVGTYTKVGRLVTFSLNLVVSAASAAAANFKVGGLPFTANGFGSGSFAYDNGTFVNSSTTNMPMIFVGSGTTEIAFFQGNGSQVLGTNINAIGSMNFYISGSYIV